MMTAKAAPPDKGKKAREKLLALQGQDKELLLWLHTYYTDEEVIQALEAAGFRWSEREGHFSWRQERFA